MSKRQIIQYQGNTIPDDPQNTNNCANIQKLIIIPIKAKKTQNVKNNKQ